MSFSQHKLQFSAPVRQVTLIDGDQRRRSAADLQTARKEGYQEGYEAGQKSLSEQLVQQRTQLIELQRGIFESLSSALPQLVSQCEQGLIQLSLQCSRRVVAGLPITPEAVEAVVREALREVQGISEYTIRLHPEDLVLLQELQSATLPAPGQTAFKVAADPAMERGGCLLDTPFGTVDATRTSKFNHLERLLQP